MARLAAAWPDLQRALDSRGPGDPRWAQTLAEVGRRIGEAQALVAAERWAQSHEVLEHVRLALFQTRRQLGIAYLLDDFTAYHEVMEKITGATSPDAGTLRPWVEEARQAWQRVLDTPIDAAQWGLSPARASQWQRASRLETDALAQLAKALATPGADLAPAAAAIKGPFIQAYTAFGWPPNEAEPVVG